ncbi:YczE/YyaS/YitT family protein [Candidatus Enterococcus ferrettii]|uniref:Integral membrane protein n=1 Tax=Candidatus Enterococcus ferrettii TaxID=2815324 RepID=A0ABV0ET23_9ENTE|nr:hypothetical protein [Enterococcus sp. 665A]MBO1342599.1 hypothetical protein [Enterococcus sp. 665A]
MKRILILILGLSLMALGASVCTITGLGIDPFNALCVAFSNIFNIQLGNMVLILQAVLGIIVLLFDRTKLGVGTLIPMVLFGYLLQFFNWSIPQVISNGEYFLSNLFIFLSGALIIALGMSTYMECEIGMVPYDCLSFIIGERIKKNPFTFRMIIDTFVAVAAFILGGPINFGTVLLALLIGPLINLFRKKVTYRLFSMDE